MWSVWLARLLVLRIFHIHWRHILSVSVNQCDLILARVRETNDSQQQMDPSSLWDDAKFVLTELGGWFNWFALMVPNCDINQGPPPQVGGMMAQDWVMLIVGPETVSFDAEVDKKSRILFGVAKVGDLQNWRMLQIRKPWIGLTIPWICQSEFESTASKQNS